MTRTLTVDSVNQMKLATAMKDALLDAYAPEAVILFGSLGRGDADEFSDVDLLIVMKTDRDVKELGEEMAEYLDHLSRDRHTIVRTVANFCRHMDIPGTLAFSARREGQALFEKPGWCTQNLPVDSYALRKKEVLKQEYAESALDFLAQAQSAFEKGNLFRCRDFMRFAAARAIKGLFVKHDVHPPRGTDLEELLEKVKGLEPDFIQNNAFTDELNAYCPGKPAFIEKQICHDLLERTSRFVDEILSKYDLR
jgi:predicted nucleotidyltransferase/HEPN domain-containing protein